jgi:hypothetical protein
MEHTWAHSYLELHPSTEVWGSHSGEDVACGVLTPWNLASGNQLQDQDRPSTVVQICNVILLFCVYSCYARKIVHEGELGRKGKVS